jgi:hypothetical protein
VGDPLIKKFKKENLQLIMDNNGYHSPEDSETDQETGKRKIMVKDLRWRSSTVSSYEFINALFFFVI